MRKKIIINSCHLLQLLSNLFIYTTCNLSKIQMESEILKFGILSQFFSKMKRKEAKNKNYFYPIQWNPRGYALNAKWGTPKKIKDTQSTVTTETFYYYSYYYCSEINREIFSINRQNEKEKKILTIFLSIYVLSLSLKTKFKSKML